jgi:hypothetical protein
MKYDINPMKAKIAASWPRSIDDSFAKAEWGWSYDVTMYDLAHKILENVDDSYKKGRTLNMVKPSTSSTGKKM